MQDSSLLIKHGIKLGTKTADQSDKWWEVWYLVENLNDCCSWSQLKVFSKMWTKAARVEGETKAQRLVNYVSLGGLRR